MEKKNVFSNGPLAVYIGKKRPEFGYAEFFKGRAKTFFQAKRLACKQCKVGDKVILKNGTKVILKGTIIEEPNQNGIMHDKPIKTVKWDK